MDDVEQDRLVVEVPGRRASKTFSWNNSIHPKIPVRSQGVSSFHVVGTPSRSNVLDISSSSGWCWLADQLLLPVFMKELEVPPDT